MLQLALNNSKDNNEAADREIMVYFNKICECKGASQPEPLALAKNLTHLVHFFVAGSGAILIYILHTDLLLQHFIT